MVFVQLRSGVVTMWMEDVLLVVLLLSMLLKLSHVKLMDAYNTFWEDVKLVTQDMLYCTIHANCQTV